MVGFGVTRVHIYFSKIKNVQVCQVVDQAKIASILVQIWIGKNEVIDLIPKCLRPSLSF